MKDFLLIVLMCALGGMVYVQVGPKYGLPMPSFYKDKAVLDGMDKVIPSAVIGKARIGGLTLSTPIIDIAGMLDEQGFECVKERADESIATQDSLQSEVWHCILEGDPQTRMNIAVKDGRLSMIKRTGVMPIGETKATLSYIEDLRQELNNSDAGVAQDQVAAVDEAVAMGPSETMNYNLMIHEKTAEDGSVQSTTSYAVTITRE
jgi:hypothetical protein